MVAQQKLPAKQLWEEVKLMRHLKYLILNMACLMPLLVFASAPTESITKQLVKQRIAYTVLYDCEAIAAQKIKAIQAMNISHGSMPLSAKKVIIFNTCVNGVNQTAPIGKVSDYTLQAQNIATTPVLTAHKIRALIPNGKHTPITQPTNIY